MNINVKQVLLFILGIIILFFLAHIFLYVLLFIIICWIIYMIYKAVRPYIKNRKPRAKNGKIIIEAKYKEK